MTTRIREALKRSLACGMAPKYAFMCQHGQVFEGSQRPAWVEQGRPKRCYENADALAWHTMNHDVPCCYTEGFAMGRDGSLFDHAWCVRDGRVIDPTLRDIIGHEFIGVVVPLRILWLHQVEFKYFGCFHGKRGEQFIDRWLAAKGDMAKLLEIMESKNISRSIN
jgi:hypothetical protein